jgi:hypothetical protein
MSDDHYKILARCIGVNVKRYKKLSKQQLHKKIKKRFININADQEHAVAHIQQLSKINGIFFPKGTISEEGKQFIITRIIHSISNETFSVVSQDKYSVQKILGFISNNAKINGTPPGKLSNPYAKKPITTNTSMNVLDNPPSQHMTRAPSQNLQEITGAPTHNTTTPIINNNLLPALTKNVTVGTPETVENSEVNDIPTTTSRIELRLCMTPINTENGDINQLRRQLYELLLRIREADPRVQLWSWHERINDSPLDHNNIPTDIRLINRYFNRLFLVKHGMVHGEFRMEHSRRWEDIISDLTPWLSSQRYGLYYQPLQCPSTTNLGWLLWSFRRIDTEVLQRTLLLDHGINVTLRYQNIILHRDREFQPSNRVMALHVICNKMEADRVASVLKTIYPYDRHVESFPLDIVLRFIPHIFRVKRDKLQKITRLRARQETFLNAIENSDRPMNATSWEILTLDTTRADFGTVRSQIMQV